MRVVIPPWDDPAALSGVGRTGSISTTLISTNGKPAGVQVVSLPLPMRVPGTVALTYGLIKRALWPAPDGMAGAPLHSRARDHALRDLATFRPEVVHVFKPVGYSGLAALALQAMRIPWALDMDDWEGPGGWADVNPYTRAEKAAVTLLEAALPRMAGAVTTASRTLEARAWDFGLPRSRALYMPNGVWKGKYGSWANPPLGDIAALKERYKLSGFQVILLYTRFAEFPYWWPLDVLKSALKEHPQSKLLVVGSGFFGEESKLMIEAERMGLAEYVAFAGRVAEAGLPAHMALGDVALYPMADNLINRAKSPVKLLELMVAGLPIVAHRLGQSPEFLGDAAILVEPGDLPGMGAAASTLLANPGLRTRLAERARARVWSKFNWERLSETAERAYAQVLTRRS